MTLPMLAMPGVVENLSPKDWAFEGKWDGYRAQLLNGRLYSRKGHPISALFPQFVLPDLAGFNAVLDGELVVLNDDGVPDFAALQRRTKSTRVEFWAFDLLGLDDRMITQAPYRNRRKLLETLAEAGDLVVPKLLTGDVVAQAERHKWEGIVAKRWNSRYYPGRSPAWIKHKLWQIQEVVIGGWREGERGIGSLLMGIPEPGGLRFIGRVGTGFSDMELLQLGATMVPTETSPFSELPPEDAKGAIFVQPTLVGEVRYGESTGSRLRHPVWRGLRHDKSPSEVTL